MSRLVSGTTCPGEGERVWLLPCVGNRASAQNIHFSVYFMFLPLMISQKKGDRNKVVRWAGFHNFRALHYICGSFVVVQTLISHRWVGEELAPGDRSS